MTRDEIKLNLNRGDYQKIARIAGYKEEKELRTASQYVYEILNTDKYKASRGLGKKLLDIAEAVAYNNKLTIENLSNKFKNDDQD